MSRRRKHNRRNPGPTPTQSPAKSSWATPVTLVVSVVGVAVAIYLIFGHGGAATGPGRAGVDSPVASSATTSPAAPSPASAAEKRTDSAASPSASARTAASTAPAAADSAKAGDNGTASAKASKEGGLERLKGEWVRPDGGYVLEVKGVGGDGKAEVTYANPNGPIHVSEAKASREHSSTKLFVELRDAGYPGCTYNLTYDPQSDRLRGVYFQAAMQEQYEVSFERVPPAGSEGRR
jgi:hypothetical protein